MRRLALTVLLTGLAATAPAQERLDLEVTTVVGSQELPKVLYIVPWQQSDLPDLSRPTIDRLVEEALVPVDRDVLRRQAYYHQALSAQDAEAGAAQQ